MQVQGLRWASSGDLVPSPGQDAIDPALVLYFGSRDGIASGGIFAQLKSRFPDAQIIGCSTGGQIHDDDNLDDEIAAVAITFESTQVRVASRSVETVDETRASARAIAEELNAPDLAGIFILSDGLNVNGSELVAGITDIVGKDIPLTGGLAGDGAQFEQTLLGVNDTPRSHLVAGIGFYGACVRFGHGSAGGWDVFGPRRRITRSSGNVLYDLDGEPALDLYERYLGDEAAGLPSTGLLFPLQIVDPDQPDHKIVRTILGIDRERRSMTFAGEIPDGWNAQLMRGNFARLAEGAADAARQASHAIGDQPAHSGLALMVSCIGRRLLMGQRTMEEVEAASASLPAGFHRMGFYSYGEISPHAESGICELHNQTMTVTTIHEADAPA